jgi:lysozyme
MTETIDQAIKMLAQDEGLRETVYLDSKNIPTIGYGRNLKTKGVSKDEALYMLTNDINEALKNLMQQLPWFSLLCVPRQVVLIDMTINLGFHGVMLFKQFLGFLQRGSYQDAANDLRTTDVYKQLTNRYERLAKIIESGNYESN